MPATKGKVVCAMSGGVDSSVAAALLKQQGYEVVGVFMRLGTPDGVGAAEEVCEAPTVETKSHKQGCCSVLDAVDARRVAQALDIPFYVLNFQQDFERVISYFVGEYNAGRTPNPCVRCNDWLKFGKLAQYAKNVGADFVASGHYARVGTGGDGQPALMRGIDHKKDQSYVLFGMTRDTLAHTLLPIGGFDKAIVRQMAHDLGLPTFNKPDSQEICFVPDQDYAGLVRRRTPDRFAEGEFVTSRGEVIGTHAGYQQFTIGQRKGLGGEVASAGNGRRQFVTGIDPETRRVTLGDVDDLLRTSLTADQGNWLSRRVRPGCTLPVMAKVRYNHQPVAGTLRVSDDEAATFCVDFDEPLSAITPGQAVVCYDGEEVLGGGWIASAR